MFLNWKKLRDQYGGLKPEGRSQLVGEFREAITTGEIKANQISLKGLATALLTDREGNPIGRDYVEACDPSDQGSDHSNLLEAVDSGAFKNVTGQIIFSTMLQEYERYTAAVERLHRNVPTKLNGEKIPGVTGIGDQAESIREGEPYPSVGIGEDWIETPETTKKGLKIEITKETLFFDLTNLIIDRANKVGEWLGINKAKAIVDMAIGVTNNHKWKGTAYDTYQTTTPWVNIKTSNGLADWTDIDGALQTFAGLTDPHTGEPIMITPTQILCRVSLASTARYVLNATQIVVDPNANTGTSQYQLWASNNVMVPGNYEVLSNPVIDARFTAGSVTATDWFFGDFQRAFAYMENWPITVTPMPSNSYEEWNRDIVAGWKASERGTPAVLDPRYAQQNQA